MRKGNTKKEKNKGGTKEGNTEIKTVCISPAEVKQTKKVSTSKPSGALQKKSQLLSLSCSYS
jgi:hypothetical protein